MASTSDNTEEITGGAAAWLQDRTLRAAIWLAQRLPYERRVLLFGALTRHALRNLTSFRRRMLDNLDYIWPDLPLADRKAIADRSAENLGRSLIEHYSMRELGERMAAVTPEGPGWQHLQSAHAEGRPTVLITGHYGNYEAAWACLLTHGIHLGGLYRPMGNPFVNRHYVKALEIYANGPLFEQGPGGMRLFLKHLKRGGAAMILNDLYVGGGVELEFLGKPARTALSTAELALRMNAELIPFYGIRQADGVSFRVVLEAPIAPGTASEMTAAFNESVAARIEEDPGQWFWTHRRWKRKWQGGAGMEPDLHPAALPRQKSR